MKRFLILSLVTVVATMTFGIIAQTSAKSQNTVEVLYFHGKQRCATCIAVGKYTQEVVNIDMAQQKKNGTVKFREIDFSTPEGEKIADKYKVSFSGLVLVQHKGKAEKANDVTRFAFQYARTDTPRFKTELKAKITNLLK